LSEPIFTQPPSETTPLDGSQPERLRAGDPSDHIGLTLCCSLLTLGCFVSNALHTAALCLGWILLLRRLCQHGRFELSRLPGIESPIALYIASFIASSVLGINPAVSLSYTSELTRISVAFLVTSSLRCRRDAVILLSTIVVGACSTTAYAFFQHLWGGEYTRLLITRAYRPFELGTPFGFASTCNDLAVLLAMSFGLVAAPALFCPISRRLRALLAVCALFMGAGILRTLSRSGLVGALAGLLITGRLLSPKRLLIVVGGLICLYPALPEDLKTRHYQFFDASVVPNAFRVRMVELSLEMAREHPLWGIGRRNFGEMQMRLRRTIAPGIKEFISPNAHNNYLNVLVEQGVFGLIALVWLQISLFTYLLRQLLRTDLSSDSRATLAGLFMALVSFTLAGLFDFYWGFALPVTVSWILVGIAYAVGEKRVLESPL